MDTRPDGNPGIRALPLARSSLPGRGHPSGRPPRTGIGIDAHAGRNTARLALAAELPASVLADLTGISISTAERWSQWAKRDWAAYVGQRAADNAEGVDSRKPAKQTLQTC